MKLYEIQEMFQKKHDEIFTKNEVFFAFSDQQFAENCTRGVDNPSEKYFKMFGGGFYPKENSAQLRQDLDEWEAEMIAYYLENVPMDDYIENELADHECWYTGDWHDEDRLLSVQAIYKHATSEDMHRVYKERAEQNND